MLGVFVKAASPHLVGLNLHLKYVPYQKSWHWLNGSRQLMERKQDAGDCQDEDPFYAEHTS